MRLDCHIHATYGEVTQEDFISRLDQSGVDGGIVLSHRPGWGGEDSIPSEKRMENVLNWTEGHEYLFPFFFIDPTDENAIKDVKLADSLGIKGFKIICSTHYPSDSRAIPVYEEIANRNLPILFHSGILYDGKNASGNFNKPTEFEILLSIDNLRFAMAHISWPWTDECIAVYGKFNSARRRESIGAPSAEMFIDISPGTPPIYRKDALEKLLLTGYDIENNVLWGVDSSVNNYVADYAIRVAESDDKIFSELKIPKETKEKIYFRNLLRFVGIADK